MDEASDVETVWNKLLLVPPQWQTAYSATQWGLKEDRAPYYSNLFVEYEEGEILRK